MSEKVLGIIGVIRETAFRIIPEVLFLMPDRLIVARASSEEFGGTMFDAISAELPLEDILKTDKHNYAIPNSEIIKVKLKKQWLVGAVELRIEASKKKQKWIGWGAVAPIKGMKFEDFKDILPPRKMIAKKKKGKLEDYEDILRPVFGDKLSVKK